MERNQFWANRVREGAVLSPIDRISEVLFGLIMVLTFTGAISVVRDKEQEVGDLLWAALGCNVAWGIVDAIMYLMNTLLDRARSVKFLLKLRQSDTTTSLGMINEELTPTLAALMDDRQKTEIFTKLKALPEPPKRIWITFRDLVSCLEIFLLVFLCTLPVALPFVFMNDVELAKPVSNGIAILMLFIGGYRLAKYAGLPPGLTALVYMAIGLALVFLTMALGG